MATPNFERVRAAIAASSVSDDHKKELSDIFAEVSDDCLADIADLFEQKGGWVEKFDENRTMKRDAASSGDPSAWQQILEREKKYLEELTYGLD